MSWFPHSFEPTEMTFSLTHYSDQKKNYCMIYVRINLVQIKSSHNTSETFSEKISLIKLSSKPFLVKYLWVSIKYQVLIFNEKSIWVRIQPYQI